ncbi:MAG: AAA family ATPase [Spirochaetes bacterium]|nr:AAA family ATPase [Spirochaetota bacterium]
MIEDVSGVGKTTLLRCLAKASSLDYGRIQFTPDLLPGDITGMTIWDPVKHEFIFREGPLRHQFILADELNRAPARTQSALLEAMQEEAVTVDGVRYPMPAPFFVAAAQNPFWYAGTYKLPESQLDRFGISITPGYPDIPTETLILDTYKNSEAVDRVSPVITAQRILEIRNLVRSVQIEQKVLGFAAAIGRETRESEHFQAGLSTRGLQHLIRLAQSNAVMGKRNFLIPEDILSAAEPVLQHRLMLTPEARSEGKPMSFFIKQVVSRVQIPYE